MELLDKLVIPQPENNLYFMNYLLVIALVIFWIYSALIVGSSILSLIFRSRASSEQDDNSLLSREYIDLVTSKFSYAFGLGFIPFLAIIFLYMQITAKTVGNVLGYLGFSFVVFLVGLFFIYNYRRSLHLRRIFARFDSTKPEGSEDGDEYSNFKSSNNAIYSFTGNWGFILVLVAMWVFIGSITVADDPKFWGHETLFNVLLSIDSLLKFIMFILSSVAVTALTFLFLKYSWEKDKTHYSESLSKYALHVNTHLALWFTMSLPLFFVISLAFVPASGMSVYVFASVLIGLFFALGTIHFIYSGFKENNGMNFRVAMFGFVLFIATVAFKEKSTLTVGSQKNFVEMNVEYEKHHEELMASLGLNTEAPVNAEEIYKSRCMACHKPGGTPQAPDHAVVVLKYKGKKDELVKFILNPHKVDPQYPPMPNQGLSPKEAQAMADYLLGRFAGEGEKSKTDDNKESKPAH